MKEDLSRELEEMDKPQVRMPEHERRLRLAFVNARRSAWWGAALIVLPALVILLVLRRQAFGLTFGSAFVEATDTPWLLLAAPFAALLINLLAILHVSGENSKTEAVLHFAVKKRPWNIAIILLAAGLLAFALGYAVLENWECMIGLRPSC
jgi:hypothetical protein